MAGRSLPVCEQMHVVGHECVVFNVPSGGGQLFEALYDCAGTVIRPERAEALVGVCVFLNRLKIPTLEKEKGFVARFNDREALMHFFNLFGD